MAPSRILVPLGIVPANLIAGCSGYAHLTAYFSATSCIAGVNHNKQPTIEA